MAAIQRTQMSSPKLGALAVAVAAAMLVGGAGGYLVRALSTQGPAPAHIATVQVRQATGTSADEPRSQWLREHATGTELDGLLKSVNYEGGATIANPAARHAGP